MMTPEYKKLGELVANDADISSKVIIAKVSIDYGVM